MKNKAPIYSYKKGIFLLLIFLTYIVFLFWLGNLAFTLISFPIAVFLFFIAQMVLVCPACGEMVYDTMKSKFNTNLLLPIYLLRFFWVPPRCNSCGKDFR